MIEIRRYHPHSKIIVIYLTHQYIKSEYDKWGIHPFAGLANIFIFDPEPSVEMVNDQLYKVMETCTFCYETLQADDLRYTNSWKMSSGFKSPLVLPHSFKDNYFKKSVAIATELDPMNIWVAGVKKIQSPYYQCINEYAGPIYDDYLMLSKMLNFTL